MIHRALTIALIATGCSETSHGPGSDAAPSPDGGAAADTGVDAGPTVDPLGTVTPDGACDPGPLAGTTCAHLVVGCPGVADRGVGVRVTQPAGAARGTVLLGTGGTGTGFFEESDEASAALTIDLVDDGYVVARRSWDDPGWFAGSAGVRASSCRYATLLAWIDDDARAGTAPLCAFGISGGAIEIGYALARSDAGDRLSAAILAAGPSMTRLDLVCPSVADAGWQDVDCPALARTHGLSCPAGLLCLLQGAAEVVDSAWSPRHPCTDSADADPAALAADGIVSPDARLSYPSTRTRFVFGEDECSVTPLLFYDAVTSDRSLVLVPGAGHDGSFMDLALEDVRAAIAEACAP